MRLERAGRGRGGGRSRRGSPIVVGALVGVAAVAVAALAFSPTAGASVTAGRQLDPEPAPGAGLSRQVDAVPASSPILDGLLREGRSLESQRDRAATELLEAAVENARVDEERTALTALVARRDEQIRKTAATRDELRADLLAVTVQWYVTGFGVADQLDPTLDADGQVELDRQRVLALTATEDTLADVAHSSAKLDVLRFQVDAYRSRAAGLGARSEDLGATRSRLSTRIADLETRMLANAAAAREARMLATVDGTDMSTLALDAYWRAEQAMSLLRPDCGVRWWALAGIGRTESRHGTYRDSQLGVDGIVTPPIYGPALDGSNEFAVVPDSDGGALDALSTTDRAVGPMQFLPGTWRTVGTDGTGDGIADPQNLYDAAVSAGMYLCRSGPGLGDEQRLRAAYLTYNRSLAYVDIVTERAFAYRSTVPLA